MSTYDIPTFLYTPFDLLASFKNRKYDIHQCRELKEIDAKYGYILAYANTFGSDLRTTRS